MTDYQKAQLLNKHMTGDFRYRNSKGNKVSRKAWTQMLDALIRNGMIDGFDASVTEKGKAYCNSNHLTINLGILN